MRLVVLTGVSGSGKSTALHQLEDIGFYCVDNLPAALLERLTEECSGGQYTGYEGVAVCIDARNSARDLEQFASQFTALPQSVQRKLIYLDTQDPVLFKRFSETRRRHPLSRDELSLAEAMKVERDLLEPLAAHADLVLDTTQLTLYELRSMISSRVGETHREGLSILVESFGFKKGVPSDADLVFDARLLPNPHWERHLRPLTGKDPEVIQFLETQADSADFVGDLVHFLERWLPRYEQSQRSYVTVAIGCTGGQHRSVYVAEQVWKVLQKRHSTVQLRHRELRSASPA